MIKTISCLAAALFLVFAGFAGTYATVRVDADDAFEVEFTNCVESIGVGLIPTAQVQSLVPPEFHLAGEGQPVTPIVVRTSRCEGIAVDGHNPNAGSAVQIGVVIVPPDFSGDINNYTLWYYTSDAKLAHYLQRLGVAAQHVPTIDYDYEPAGASNSLFVAITAPGNPVLSLAGTVSESTTLAGSFEAIWWAKANVGNARMDTSVPAISIGSANLTLMTGASGALGQLIGGSSMGFPALQQFNTFSSAHMGTSVAAP